MVLWDPILMKILLKKVLVGPWTVHGPTHLDANAAEYYFQLYPNIGYKEKILNIEKQYKNIPES